MLVPHQENLERLRRTLKIDLPTWTEMLNVSQDEYRAVVENRTPATDQLLTEIEAIFDVQVSDLMKGRFDFTRFACENLGSNWQMLPRYREAAFGRLRTTLTVLDYIGDFHGWQKRLDLLDRFHLNEAMVADARMPISIQLPMDIFDAMSEDGLNDNHFYEMGTYSVVTNLNTEVPDKFAECRTPVELFENWEQEVIKLFEHNLRYRLVQANDRTCVFHMRTQDNVADAYGVEHIGNTHTCAVRNGVMASLPLYMGLPLASAIEKKCVHRGDEVCEVEVDLEEAYYAHRKYGFRQLAVQC